MLAVGVFFFWVCLRTFCMCFIRELTGTLVSKLNGWLDFWVIAVNGGFSLGFPCLCVVEQGWLCCMILWSS